MAWDFLINPTGASDQNQVGRVARAHRGLVIKGRRIKTALGIPGMLAVTAILFGEVIGTELEMLLDSHTDVFLALGALAAAMFLMSYRWASHMPDEVGADAYGNSGTGKLAERRGLVLMVGLDSGRPDSPAAQLLGALPNLEYLALMGTNVDQSRAAIEELTDKIVPAVGLNLPTARMRTWRFANAESVADNEQAVAEAIRWMLGRGLDPAEIVVDVSAGRRAMAFGAKDAADDFFVETQYLANAWDTAANLPVTGSADVIILKQFHDQ